MEPTQWNSEEQHASVTGGGPNSRHCLTAFEEREVAVLGVSAVSGQNSSQERGLNTASPVASVPALEYACNVEDIVVQVPNSSALHLPPSLPLPPSSPLPIVPSSLFPPLPSSLLSPPLPSPPPPSSLLPPPPSFLPRSSSHRSPLRVRVRRHPRPPRQRSRFPFAPLTSEARRNRGSTPFDRIVKIFTAIEQRRLDLDERRLELEEERERLRLEFEDKRERRRLECEDERERHRLVLEDERETRRIVLEDERERRRLVLEEAGNIQMSEMARLIRQLMQTLSNNSQRVLGSSPPD